MRDYSSSHLGKGRDYDERFKSLPGRRIMMELEERHFRKFDFPAQGPFLDFACGTGRILRLLPTEIERHGLDVSAAMLSVAKGDLPSALFHEADFREIDVLSWRSRYSLVTAFRFFANAEPKLKKDAVAFISSVLIPGGLALVNNHRNRQSLSYRAMALLRKPAASQSLDSRELIDLFEDAGMRLKDRCSLGFIPQSESFVPIPQGIASRMEKVAQKSPLSRSPLGYNDVLLFVKT